MKESSTAITRLVVRGLQARLPGSMAVGNTLYLVPFGHFLAGLLFEAVTGGERRMVASCCCLCSPNDHLPLSLVYDRYGKSSARASFNPVAEGVEACLELAEQYLEAGALSWLRQVASPEGYLKSMGSDYTGDDIYRQYDAAVCHALLGSVEMSTASAEKVRMLCAERDKPFYAAFWESVSPTVRVLEADMPSFVALIEDIARQNLRHWKLSQLEGHISF